MTFKSQRTVARFSLALFVMFAMVVAVAPGISLGGMIPAALQTTDSASPSESGSASESPSESPSATASPSPTGPAIQFLNPSGHSTVVSTKNDGTNTTYHVVAATREMPSNALVEFKYQEGTSNEVSIGIASRVGSTDTFQLQWAAGGLADGTYNLKAILYAGTIEIARDEQEVTVNNGDDLDDPQAETVEIITPANGADAGFFQPAGAASAHTLVAVTSSDDTGLPSTSAGTDTVSVFYTKTPVGQEPEWVDCGSADPEGEEDPPSSMRCALAEGDSPTDVTAIAATANPALPVLSGSGDAHRVDPYVQVPTNFTLTPGAQTGKPAGTCADPVTARALDQNGAPIVGMNVDVHSKGPSDGLRFDGVNNSESQAPDAAHPEPEEAWDCEAAAAGGEQGDHELSPGNPDIKHIESTADGTSDNGEFVFQLYSPDQGRTDFAIFADVDDDDQWCDEEESTLGSITFSPSASPSPSPSESASSSPSSSASSSASGSPSAAEPTTLGPEVSSCPQPGPTPTGGEGNRTITLASSKRKVTWRRGVTLSGQITADESSCANNEVVEIVRRIHGTQQFREFRTTATDGSGAFDVDIVVRKSADYQAVAPENGSCSEVMSAAVSVLAKVKVFIHVNDRTPERGSIVRVNGRVSPKHRGDRVVLQYRKNGRWVRMAADNLNRKSRYSFRMRADWGRRVFRVRWAVQDGDHEAGNSRKMRVRSHR